MRQHFRSTLLFAILFTFVGGPLWGQDQPVDSAGEGATPPPIVTVDGERIIYVPFKDLENAFQNPDANIILTYKEYQQMLAVWKKQTEQDAGPAAVITSAEYKVTIDGELARIAAQLNVKVLGKPWVWQKISFGDAAVGKVTGDDVLMKGVGNGNYELLFSSGGDKTVNIEMAVPVSQSPDGRQFSLTTPPVAVTTLDITVPKKDQSIEVSPKVITLPTAGDIEPAVDETHLRANIGATKQMTVRWHPKTSLKPEMNLLASVTNHTLVNLEDGLIHTDAYLTYEILRGSMEQCRVIVPESYRILDVTATARIKNWKSVEQDGNQIVEVEFLSAVDKPVTVEVHTERKLENGQFDVAGWSQGTPARGIHALDAVRESGELAVRHSADINLTIAEQQGVVRTEANSVAQRLQGNNALTYKFYSPELTLKLNAKPVEPRLMVGHQIQLTFDDDELKSANSLQYSVERAGIFELKLKLPDDLTIDNVQCPQMKEYNVDEDAKELTITLRERTQGVIQLAIQSHRTLSEEESQQTLPLIEPLNVERETGTILVYARDAIEVITDQDGLVGVQPIPANQGRQGRVSLNSAWSFTRRPVAIPVNTKRKPTRLTANIGTTIDVQPEITKVQTQLNYLVEYSGVDTFRFEVPEAISDLIRIETVQGDQGSAPIKQRTPSEAVDGWVTWTVVTQREVLGNQRLQVTYDLAQAQADETTVGDADSTESDEGTIQLIRPLGLVDDDGEQATPLTNVSGEVVVKKERSLSLTAGGNGGGIEVIDLRELKLLDQSGTLAFRYFNANADDRPTISIAQSRHEIQEVISTIVSRGLVEIVTGEDAEATYRCRFNVKTTERQRLLVHLPIELEVLGAFLNDREVKLEKAELLDSESVGPNWTPFWVNVARAGSSDVPFLLTFQFLWRVNPPLGESTFGRGHMALPLPVIGDGDGSVTQELKVVVWVPEKYLLVGNPRDFHLAQTSNPQSIFLGTRAIQQSNDLSGWVAQGIDSPTSASQFPTEGRKPFVYTNLGGAKTIKVKWWNDVTITLIASIAIALIGWVLMRTSWENKLGMLLIGAFAAALFGLADSHALSQGLHAARFGLRLLAGLWVIHGIFQFAEKTKSSATTRSRALAAVAAPATAAPSTTGTASQSTSAPDTSDSSPPSSE